MFKFHGFGGEVDREAYLTYINQSISTVPVVALLGPRQCGKTTLAKRCRGQQAEAHYFDLENPLDLARLEQPMLTLKGLSGLVIIDEIQRYPDLFPILRVLVDENPDMRLLILGSASRDLIRQSSETLAGRIRYIELTPFLLSETQQLETLWLRGGFPRSFLAHSTAESFAWRQDYIQTFLERDIPNLGFNIPARTLNRFWRLLTHYHGQVFNASEIGNAMGVAHTSIRRYLDILTGTFMMRELLPWHAPTKKRQVKSPKIYFRDSGIYHALLGLEDKDAVLHHPKLGASWEGMALEQIIMCHRMRAEECYFWGIHSQAELDLLLFRGGKAHGYEFKYGDAPKLTKSMQHACEALALETLSVIYPGDKDYALSDSIEVRSLSSYLAEHSDST